MFNARVALGPIAVVTHWKNTTTAGVPSLMFVPFEKVGPKPLADDVLGKKNKNRAI